MRRVSSNGRLSSIPPRVTRGVRFVTGGTSGSHCGGGRSEEELTRILTDCAS